MIGNVIEFALKTLASVAFILALYAGVLYWVCVRPGKKGRRDPSERREYTPSRLRMTWWLAQINWSERREYTPSRLRMTWWLAQGVPARWVIDRSWRNPWLFEPRPWYCFLCGREYLPGDGAIALWVRFGFRNEDTGAFVPHDEGEWPAGLHYTPAWYHKALDLWWDRPGFAQSTTVYAHSWHFQPTDQFVPAVEVLSSDQITDTHTGQVYLEREVPAWAETLTYAARWTRARVRGVMHFPLFLFRAAWAWAWSVQPIAGLHAWAYALDGLVQALGMAKGPWPASMLLLNTLWGRPANVDWYMDLCQED